jgi:hypothetical protein
MDQNTKIIYGTVKDESGKPISNAVVSFVTAPVPLPDIAALTDTNGNFTLSTAMEGDYIINVNSDKHKEMSIRVTLDDKQKKQIEVSLVPK